MSVIKLFLLFYLLFKFGNEFVFKKVGRKFLKKFFNFLE